MDNPFRETLRTQVPDSAFQREVLATFDKQVDEVSAQGGSSAFTFPFQITDVSSGGTAIVNVNYGTCNDVLPTNVNAPFTLSLGDGTYSLYLHLTVDVNGLQTAVELDTALSGQPTDTTTDAYITLGQVIVSGGLITAIMQAATHSLRFASCSRVVVSGTVTVQGQYEFWGF